ncbi:hypothetical protein M404DRAFT_434382 [Pisolithus tinctorius Marx 270]|uniref:Uncharacterized protein n=1 Tax=Pisolithus tinctorius Marx 270 TaxID=870435 RepID=A0A0C3JBU9_PISTI|nr:hypothetical protein M404DRAFT_434382 [Pisolithus tinctorius Marx 270]
MFHFQSSNLAKQCQQWYCQSPQCHFQHHPLLQALNWTEPWNPPISATLCCCVFGIMHMSLLFDTHKCGDDHPRMWWLIYTCCFSYMLMDARLTRAHTNQVWNCLKIR